VGFSPLGPRLPRQEMEIGGIGKWREVANEIID
jgi:hypothetical protein